MLSPCVESPLSTRTYDVVEDSMHLIKTTQTVQGPVINMTGISTADCKNL